MPAKLLRTDEVAAILDISAERVATMAREGLLPAVRCGRTWRFGPSRLYRWMESGGAGGWRRSSQSTDVEGVP
jgi:excisionase family DNA binding protein